jgi:hypothetical protein
MIANKIENGTSNSELKTKTIDWCAAVSGKSRGGVIITIIINSFKRFAPQALQECPLSGDIEFIDFAIPKPFVMFYHVGDFEFFCSFYSRGKEVAKLTIDFVYI